MHGHGEDFVDALVARFGREGAIERVGHFLTGERRGRIERVLAARLGSLAIAVEGIHDPGNLLAILRTSEAFGVARFGVVGVTVDDVRRKAGRGARPWLEPASYASIEELRATAERSGMVLAAACVEPGVTHTVDTLPVERPLCLLFGGERDGLSPAARAAAALHFTVPMVGMVESLNVSVAAGVVLHTLARRRRDFLGVSGDLADDERDALRLRWYAASVDPRLIGGLLSSGGPPGDHAS